MNKKHNLKSNWEKCGNVFFDIAAIILIIAGLSKISGLFWSDSSPWEPDVIITFLPTWLFLILAGGLELIVATICIKAGSNKLKALSLLWLSIAILTYRFLLINKHANCNCLGNFENILPQEILTTIEWSIAIGLFAGSSLYFFAQIFAAKSTQKVKKAQV